MPEKARYLSASEIQKTLAGFTEAEKNTLSECLEVFKGARFVSDLGNGVVIQEGILWH